MRASDFAAILGISAKTVNWFVPERIPEYQGASRASISFKFSCRRDAQRSTLAIEKPSRERHGHV
jgi:hypothetical protein